MTSRLLFSALVFTALSYATFTQTAAQDFFDDEPPEFLPGLIAEYRCGETSIRRADADVLFHWGKSARDGRLKPNSDFSANWTGQLLVKESGPFQLSLFACGAVRVSLNGELILATETLSPGWLACEPQELRFGPHDLRIEFSRTSDSPQIGLYWSGPSFAIEPVAPRYLRHASAQTPDNKFAIGQALSRGLRCAACHESTVAEEPLTAPALTHLQDNLRPSWLVQQLTMDADVGLASSHQPYFGMHRNDAAAISAALFKASARPVASKSIETQLRAANARRGKKVDPIRVTADAQQGQITFVSTGCVACHQIDELGEPQGIDEQLFGGGDLSRIAMKRTPDFFTRWFEDPAQINASHRMPAFDLSLHERLDLAAYLSEMGSDESRNDTRAFGDIDRGTGLIQRYRCGACHALPPSLAGNVSKIPIGAGSNWDGGCLSNPNGADFTPDYNLDEAQRLALREYYTTLKTGENPVYDGRQLLAENNCLACHERDLATGLKAELAAIAEAVPDVASRLAAIAPPALTGVGDKLHDHALRDAIARRGPTRRTWLDVRMPKYDLSEEQLKVIVDYLVAHDRIPDRDQPEVDLPSDLETQMAAGRLVTAEGFGCQSCHQIADSQPLNVALNARGTDLTMLGDRIRPTWFQRWVRNPARIVPRMEMPAIQTAVRGVLGDSLDVQLEALWTTLNTPGYRPPRPNPVRVVRTHNLPNYPERAYVLTDVLESPHRNYLRPLVFGLPNRHNLLFDLEAGSLAAWWIGDAAHQHTRGKSWYWETGGQPLVAEANALESFAIVAHDGATWQPTISGQFATRLDSLNHIENGVEWEGRVHLKDDEQNSRWIGIRQSIYAAEKGVQALTKCETELTGLADGDRLRLTTAAAWSRIPLRENDGWRVAGQLPNAICDLQFASKPEDATEHTLLVPASAESQSSESASIAWTSSFRSVLPTDQFPVVDVPPFKIPPRTVDVVPGYSGVQLPLPISEMPISLAWDEEGAGYAGSLKGHVLQLLDTDGDGLEDTYGVISDEMPTPFGLYATSEGLDVLAKFALFRLTEAADGGPIRAARVIADGWGYTADYHDWAIGLERDAQGNYYMALPCQQDDRSSAAAYLRGTALKLVPYNSTEEPRKYRIEPLAAGLRFPIGIALNTDGELFTSDNQGNYNPFNELNHLRQGKRYGFINKLENKDGFAPPFESPAINLPHPWTRSVNGICFLETPTAMKDQAPCFGPFEGHLVGCEMNGRSLVRMSLQKVGNTYQGAAYPFSRPPAAGEVGFEGPIVCEVSPDGALYVGSLQDSGWSGGQNTGSIVRLRPGELPLGIAEVRATASGFVIDFTGPVDAEKASDPSAYAIRSYRRISTPAYGGDDQDDRAEHVQTARVSADRRQVTLQLNSLREGFVYEFNMQAIGADDTALFPEQAHYTLRSIP